MGTHVLLNLLNELGKRDKMCGCVNHLSLLVTSFINSVIHEHNIFYNFDINRNFWHRIQAKVVPYISQELEIWS